MILSRDALKFLLISVLICFTIQAESSDDVVELTDKTLNDFLSSHDNVLLEFYTAGCPHCEDFAPIYSDLAKQVKASGLNVQVAKIDGNKYEEPSTEYGIQGFPTIKFINSKNNIKSDYNGERTVEALIKYIDHKLNRKVAGIADSTHLAQLEKDRKVFIVFCGTNDTFPETFTQIDSVIAQHEDLEFYYTDNHDVQSSLGCSSHGKPDVVIVKNFDEGKLLYDYNGIVNTTHFQEWLSVFTTPIILELTDQNIQMSMHNQIPTVFVITKNGTDSRNIDNMVYNQAKQHRREVIFISSNNAQDLAEKILEFYQVKPDDVPAILGLYPSGESQIAKYKYTGEINESAFQHWIQDFIAQKLPRFFQSDPIPSEPLHEGVTVVVGNNFPEVVVNNNKDVLLEIYAPWCGHCKQFAPKYHRLATKLANNKNLVISKMDGTSNEYPGLDIEGFPSIIFFKGGEQSAEDKFKNRKVFDGERNVQGVIEYLKNNTFHGISDVITIPNEAQIEEKEKADEEKMGGEGDEDDMNAGGEEEGDENEQGELNTEQESQENPAPGVHDEM